MRTASFGACALYAQLRIGGAVAEDINARGICLPSSSSLTPEDQQFIIDRIREAHTLAKDRARFGES